ncbi:Cutinase [Mycolicibacterium chubuense NBB4]|uniref:Cutinase n=1 Tax=Mycolicibacterium chubuense (strain NBB4) TaxID=710421 RepID=I4BRC3_MYCCN|nr:cutinase family protein [Mycolicibacterium chubuense]AFM19830.1 Cutinase [Mycolicibacterium chubuense NBB4]
MRIRRTVRAGAAAVAVSAAVGGMAVAGALGAPPRASAQPCPDVEVVFARGTSEPPGVGATGQAFVDAVRAQAAPRSVGVYAVNYPASNDFGGGAAFARTVVDGIRDEANHVEAMAANCPDTKLVLGGYSQGAAVSGFVTSGSVPNGYAALDVPPPLPAQATDHVAAVVLFGTPSGPLLSKYGAPAITIGPRFADKTLQLCVPGDGVCSGGADGGPNLAHALYAVDGLTNQGAAYAVGRL